MPDLANNPRAVETSQAQGNNSIISNLAGAASQQPMSAPAPAPAPTQSPQPASGGDFSAVQGVVPQGAVNAASQMSDQLYGRGVLQGAENASEQVIQQLFQYDQMLDKGYSPFPQVQGYVENPADMYAGGAAFAGGMSNIQGGINRGVSTIESGYQAAISGLLDKFTDFYRMKQEEEEKRKDREYQDKRDAFETSLMIAKLVGGDVTLPDGRTVRIDSDADREIALAQKKGTVGGGTFNIADALGKLRGGATTTTKPTGNAVINQINSSSGSQPNYSGVYKVRDKATGQTGSIPSNEYDPSKYEFIK